MVLPDETLKNLVDLISLLYHEARNVRHPISARKLPSDSKYNKLINLPRNRVEAWRHMSKLREKAATAQKAADIVRVFQEAYILSLEELLVLYHASCWKGSAYGGNKWGPICSRVRDLVEVLESADEARSAQLFEIILRMEHNTGTVERKLQGLKER